MEEGIRSGATYVFWGTEKQGSAYAICVILILLRLETLKWKTFWTVQQILISLWLACLGQA